MAHWNYRIKRFKYDENGNEVIYYGIVEAHYKTKRSKKPYAWTEPLRIESDSKAGIEWQLEHMKEALDRPIIE